MSDGYSTNTAFPVDAVKLVKQLYDEWIASMEKRMKEEKERMMEEKKKYAENIDALQKDCDELLMKNVELQQKLNYLENQCGISLSSKRKRLVKFPPFLPRILDFDSDLSFDHSFPGVLVEALPLWRKTGLFNRLESTSQKNAETFFAEFCKILNSHLPDINFEAVPQPDVYFDTANNLGERKLDILI